MLIELSDSVDFADDSGTVLSDSNLFLKDPEALEIALCELLMFTFFLTC